MKSEIVSKGLSMALAVLAFGFFSQNAFAAKKPTLGEIIDQAKQVKVFFRSSDISHFPVRPVVAGKKPTGCTAFKETTALPEGYTSVSKKIVEMLNEGLKTTAFAEGDIKSFPKIEGIKGTALLDWLKENDQQLVALVTFFGTYEVENNGLMGEIKLSNSMTIGASLSWYTIVDGKIKQPVLAKTLAHISSKSKSTKKCDTYDYFVANFPADSLVEPFNASVEKKLAGFTAKQMKKYNKAMKKKKK